VGRGRRPPRPAEVAARYDAGAGGYDARHGRETSRRRFAIIDGPQLALARGAGRVLEIGCGTGRLLAETDARVRIGIDVSAVMARQARQRGLAVALADAHALPFASEAFDAVLAGKGVFRYLDYGRGFAECARVLRPGGRLGVHQYSALTWTPRHLLGPKPAAEPLHVEDLDELRGPARRAGLRCEQGYLWRSVRFPPYALRIPEWAPGQLWSHCVLVFGKPAHAGGS
jgi:SAM-dependent methyltransferase